MTVSTSRRTEWFRWSQCHKGKKLQRLSWHSLKPKLKKVDLLHRCRGHWHCRLCRRRRSKRKHRPRFWRRRSVRRRLLPLFSREARLVPNLWTRTVLPRGFRRVLERKRSLRAQRSPRAVQNKSSLGRRRDRPRRYRRAHMFRRSLFSPKLMRQ